MAMSPEATPLSSGSSRTASSGDADSFADFLQRIRAGDAQAATELVRQYESTVRLEVRMRLRSQRLRRVIDSMDICQSVLASFFVRAAAGQFDLEEPKQLVKLLVGIARNKVAFQARKEQAQRRDNRRVEAVDLNDLAVAASGPSPSELVAGAELLQVFRQRLSPEERQLADLRARDLDWAEIAAEVGGTAAARRMQFARAMDRVAQQMGLEPPSHG
jgi:RNA polymerase sigma-70 factor (ECF subfamily)